MKPRKYGDKDSHPVPLWNGVFEHYGRIRDALWEFLWCIDAITKEKDGIGLVLGGSPVKLKRIVADLKADKETVRRHLKSLADENYIRVRRTPYGQIIEVLNSRKFGIWRKEKPHNAVSLPVEKPIHESEKPICEPEKPQNAVSKEDSAVTQQEDAAGKAAALASKAKDTSAWEAIGAAEPFGSPGFRDAWEQRYSTRNGHLTSEAMERAILYCKPRGIAVPKTFYELKRQVEAGERGKPDSEIPLIAAEPFAPGRY